MSEIIIIGLGIIMVISAFIAIYSKKLLAAIVASGVISLFASIVYLVLHAPDVAMTEAAIGSALTTIVFIFAFTRIKKILKDESDD